MFNKYTKNLNTTIVDNRLQLLLRSLIEDLQLKKIYADSSVLNSISNAVYAINNNRNKALFNPEKVIPGTLPNPNIVNNNFLALLIDLETLFKETTNLSTIIGNNFNYLVVQAEEILTRIRNVFGLVEDLALFSSDQITFVNRFLELFNNINIIDYKSALLSNEQASINIDEGIVTLPILPTSLLNYPVKTIVINPESNGVLGNNQQLNVPRNASFNNMFDQNPDTWTEFELVQNGPTRSNPLVWDFTIALQDESIVNFIRINPNNFGTPNWVKILKLETSLDGYDWITINDDKEIPSWLNVNVNDPLILSPANSKFSGQGLFTFLPRKTKFIHVILQQDQGYPITTPSGQKYRFAIGIRDFEISGYKYKSTGEIITTTRIPNAEVNKISIQTNQVPNDENALSSIEHYISPDDGMSWHQISPTNASSITIPEVLSFNTNTTDSIVTEKPVIALRYKAILDRNDKNFVPELATFTRKLTNVQEIINLPTSAPFNITLTHKPITTSVSVLNPLFGNRGKDNPRLILGQSRGGINEKYKWPYKDIVWTDIRVFVDNEEWFPVTSLINNSDDQPLTTDIYGINALSVAGNGDKVFAIDPLNQQIIFGDGINGAMPKNEAIISISLYVETPKITLGSVHKLTTLLSTDGDKDNVNIYSIGTKQQFTESIPEYSTVIHLEYNNLTLDDITFTPSLAIDNLIGIDRFNGIVYLRNSIDNTTITYSYIPRTLIDNSKWSFDPTDKTWRTIKFDDTILTIHSVTNEEFTELNTKAIILNNPGIIEGSLNFIISDYSTVLDNSLLFGQEVPFINGKREFVDLVDGIKYYSVDYRNGILYFQDTISTSITNLKVNYFYANYQIEYNIGNIIAPDYYTIDNVNSLIHIADSEIVKAFGAILDRPLEQKILKIHYSYLKDINQNVQELIEFYSPILRDILILYTTKDNINAN